MEYHSRVKLDYWSSHEKRWLAKSETKDQYDLPWCYKWKASFSRRCSIDRCSPVLAGRIPSRKISAHHRRFCCKSLKDPIRPIRRARRPVGCPCPRISCECTTVFTHMTLIALPLSRRLEECNMSHGLLLTRLTQIPIYNAERVARSFLTLQFISPARLNLRSPLASAPKATKSTSARSDEREKGASFNKSFAAGRETKSALLFR